MAEPPSFIIINGCFPDACFPDDCFPVILKRMHVRLITAEETIPLRQALLRPDRPRIESIYDGDHDPKSFHVGAFKSDASSAAIIGIATMLPTDDPRCQAAPAYRLRGMAVTKEHQRTGVGSATLHYAEIEAARRDAVVVWCNARTVAIPFYLQHGYESVGDQFELPNVGPHFFCRKSLRS